MKKSELLELTIKQLSESLNSSPECFELYADPDWPNKNGGSLCTTIIWKFKVDLNGENLLDPNNSPRTIILNYSYKEKILSCDIYFRDVQNPGSAMCSDGSIEIKYIVPIINKSYIKFMNFRKALLNRIRHKEYIDYIKKLNSIFPSTLDDKIF